MAGSGPARQDLLPFAVLGRPHGTAGDIVMRPFHRPVAGALALDVATLTEVWLERAGQLSARVVRRARRTADAWLVAFAGVPDREAVAALTHALVHVPRAALPPLAAHEYYVEDVVGCGVRDGAGRMLGTVTGVFWNGAHDVAELDVPGREPLLIPLVPSVVTAVDLGARTVTVDWQVEEDEPR